LKRLLFSFRGRSVAPSSEMSYRWKKLLEKEVHCGFCQNIRRDYRKGE
jgi:hypothetical protein